MMLEEREKDSTVEQSRLSIEPQPPPQLPVVTANLNNLREGNYLESTSSMERGVKPGADFALFYLLNAPTVYFNDLWIIDETVPTYGAGEQWEPGPATSYGNLRFMYANRAESALMGYRVVPKYYPNLSIEETLATAMYVNNEPVLP